MRRGRFTEDQIIGVLREHEAGVKTAELCPEARDQRRDVLQLEGKVWRHDRVGGGAVADAGGREPPAKEAAGGVDARRVGAEGSAGKKLTRSAERYAAVEKLMADHGFSERCACRLIGVNRRHGNISRFTGRTMLFAYGCARSRTSVVGSATGGWRSCSGARGKA
jgi:hypothetical protein